MVAMQARRAGHSDVIDSKTGMLNETALDNYIQSLPRVSSDKKRQHPQITDDQIKAASTP
jgi:hypothetical protein